ncbi:ERCC4 domain-containing protein [Diplocarpon rosae]|nr:ERCC4 domain-containing protein [Diplocarpon rosae]
MPDCANALWLEFVDEWVNTASDRNTKGVQTYKKARISLKACPYQMQHPSEAQQLFGWGEGLVKKLTRELEDWCAANNQPMPERPNKRKKKQVGAASAEGNNDTEEDAPSPAKKPRKTKEYTPKLRSGPWALVHALATVDKDLRTGITKADLIELAQPFCDVSFTEVSGPKDFYTAWNSMKTLENKDLVYSRGRPSKQYFLSEDGWELAERMKKASDPFQGRTSQFVTAERASAGPDDANKDAESQSRRSTARPFVSPRKSRTPDIVPDGNPISSDAELPSFNPIILEPGSFTVELIVDNREVKSKKNRDYLLDHLEKKDVKPTSRGLSLGDFLWVAKLHDPNLLQRRGLEGSEVVLDYVVERKRLDDLVSSIKDKRFLEQKFRLRRSGVKNVIYIIEEAKIEVEHYAQHIASAIASTQVVNGFFVKKTHNMDETIQYLVNMTRLLREKYEAKPLHLIPTKVITTQNYLPLLKHLVNADPSTSYHITYDVFKSITSKTSSLTLRDVYLKMLLCTKGVTAEKALEIQKRWKTPFELAEAYRKIDEKAGGVEQAKRDKMALVSDQMSHLVGTKKLGKAVSVRISQIWGDVDE